MDRHPRAEELGKLLQRQRESNPGLSQPKIAEQSGVSQIQISRYERAERDLWKLPGSKLWGLLTAYRFSTLDIKAIVYDFGLNVPPQLAEAEESDEAPQGMVEVQYEGTISRDVKPKPKELPVSFLNGRDPSTVRVRIVEPGDYLTAQAMAEAPVGSLLILATDVEPKEGQPIRVRVGGQHALAIHGEDASWAMPLDADEAAPLSLRGAEVVAVILGVYKRYGF